MVLPLASRALEPCPVGTNPLSSGLALELARDLPTWSVTHGQERLERAVACGSFVEAMALANRLVPVVEEANHHPDVLVRWGELRVTMWTHAIGGLHINDFIVAARIEAILGD
jgi:4a-hydroxytetrahydrobiopterin dehydratase